MRKLERHRRTAAAPAVLVLVSHGSRNPRAAAVVRHLAHRVTAARPGLDVRVAGLEHALPRPGVVLTEVAAAGRRRVTVVPLLFTEAYHARTDVPAALADATRRLPSLEVRLADVLGMDDRVVSALLRRLAASSAGSGTAPSLDALVLAVAGTRQSAALATIRTTTEAIAARTGLPCRAGYASAARPAVGEAVRQMRVAGATRVGVLACFLTPSLLYDRAKTEAIHAGAVAVAPPVGAARELAEVVLARYDAAWHRRQGVPGVVRQPTVA